MLHNIQPVGQTQSFSVNCCKNAVYKSHKIPSYQDNPVTRS